MLLCENRNVVSGPIMQALLLKGSLNGIIYLAREPKGQLTPMRIDVALVDGTGAIKVIENASMMW